MFWIDLFFIVLLLALLGLGVFAFGPEFVEWVAEKLEEWQEVIDAFKGEDG